ncbi:hypothetical protein BS78_02G396700 [Paspalum vaginatum]|nr:hypothetical protein BS78_02G396700 [Paspalum vaginatum]KAJ1292508.1 hypothetical protein BS78_02G396700 [Paspalum vaginatum]
MLVQPDQLSWMGVQTMSSHADDGRRGLTLTEVEAQLGEPLRSMNLDDLLRTVLPAAAHPPPKKTVDEVWRDIQSAGGGGGRTMGEMTLEDFLSRAGVAVAPHWLRQYPPHQQQQYAHGDGDFLSQVAGRKRGAVVVGDGVVERTVERRQKRMIKNRESAARSRARKQAYTNELENKFARLQEENNRLKMLQPLEAAPEHEPLPRPLPLPEPETKPQLRRTNSAKF